STSMENLKKQFAFLQGDAAKGVFSYFALLTLPYASESAWLNIGSTLAGVKIEAQAGLGKTADEEVPLRLDFELAEGATLPLKLQYGEQLQGYFLIDKHSERLHSGHVVFGQGQATRFDVAGLKVDIRQPVFDLSEAVGAFAAKDSVGLPPLKEITIDAGQLIWQGKDLGAFDCRFQRHDQRWQGSIDAAMAKGYFTIPEQLGGGNRIKLDMDYLNLSAMDKFDLEATDEAVTELPLIDIDSRQLLWRSVDFGRLQLQTERLANGIHFKKIQMRGGNGQIDLTADWLKQAGGSATQVRGHLKMDGFGKFLSQLGYTDDIKETSADIQFRGGWRGGPHQFAMSALDGQLQLDLTDGRISSIEPGFGRLLGLIAMEQWVKRLSLDFSDIYREGLDFDQIKGRFRIKDGQAFTDDLTVDAVAATFNIDGLTNLVDKAVNLRVSVIPKSSGAVPIAGTIVGGIASIITQVVTDDYKEGYFFGSQYQLSGNWGNVEVTPLHDEDGLVNKTWRGLTNFDWLK
ncbi:MAG: AsmA-like C-terminal region-containing protein, partial [Methylomonas sp.]|nr:AsmA-like C-terminal region-containing protein [Methylomonas sp.]